MESQEGAGSNGPAPFLSKPKPWFDCSVCREPVKIVVWFEGKPVCQGCYRNVKPVVNVPWMKVFFCEGNPGHGYISQAEARRQDDKDRPGAMRRTPDGGLETVKHRGRIISAG